MPSFDVVSEVDYHEVTNAVDQANRELKTRFDFKGTNASFVLEQNKVTIRAPNEFQIRQMLEILIGRLSKRKVDVQGLKLAPPQVNVNGAQQLVTVRQGLDSDLSREIVKLIKKQKLKVQASMQSEQVRVSGKKRDELQKVIAMLKEVSLDMPLQFKNYRD